MLLPRRMEGLFFLTCISVLFARLPSPYLPESAPPSVPLGKDSEYHPSLESMGWA